MPYKTAGDGPANYHTVSTSACLGAPYRDQDLTPVQASILAGGPTCTRPESTDEEAKEGEKIAQEEERHADFLSTVLL